MTKNEDKAKGAGARNREPGKALQRRPGLGCFGREASLALPPHLARCGRGPGFTTAGNETDYILGASGEAVTELAEDANGTMNWQRTYVYASGALIATYVPVPNPAYNPSNPSGAPPTIPLPSFRLTDWLGTMRATTDSDGVLQSACTGLPFGDGVSCDGNSPDPHHFTGKERDQESGNDYFGARYYASTMGRMLSPDPILGTILSDPTSTQFQSFISQPQNWNLYAYVLNNPLIYTDPSGMECVWDDGSYDASDDPQTGTAAGCTAPGVGGTWVDPGDFESVEGNQAGSWSGQGSSQIQFDWLTPSATVNGGSGTPLTGTFGPQDFGNMTQGQFISMMQQSGFKVSPLDTLLGKTGLGHPGTNMRQTVPICSIHVSITPGSGQNGVPVSGEFHFDLFNPLESLPAGPMAPDVPLMPLHAAFDVGPDLAMKYAHTSSTGNQECQ